MAGPVPAPLSLHASSASISSGAASPPPSTPYFPPPPSATIPAEPKRGSLKRLSSSSGRSPPQEAPLHSSFNSHSHSHSRWRWRRRIVDAIRSGTTLVCLAAAVVVLGTSAQALYVYGETHA